MIEPPLQNVGEVVNYNGWELERIDDMGGHTLASLKEHYQDQNIWDRDTITNNEVGYYTPIGSGNHKINGNGVELIAKANPDFNKASEDVSVVKAMQRYTSGMLTTRFKYSILYGRIQSTIKLPKGVGLWPAFWMLPEFIQWPEGVAILKENDIMEFINRREEVDRVYAALHSYQHGPLQSTQCMHTCPFDVTLMPHTFGVDWSPRFMKYHIDGQVFHIVPTPADHHSPMHLLWNLAVGGEWPGNPAVDTPFPSKMEILNWATYKYTGTTEGNVEDANDHTMQLQNQLTSLREDVEIAVDGVFDKYKRNPILI